MAATAPVPQLAFAVERAAPLEHAAVPTLGFDVRVTCDGVADVRAAMLDVQVQIAPRGRAYDDAERGSLAELLGPPEAWGASLRTLVWTRATVVVPPFAGETTVRVPVVCTYDLEVAGARYLDALRDGAIPLELLFSGAVFYVGADGWLQTVRIPHDAETAYELPVATWRATMDRHFPQAAWLRLGRERFDRLLAYRARRALGSWDATVDALLAGEPAQADAPATARHDERAGA
jgi:hypothetical protein